MVRIVFIGAGSVVFTRQLVVDLLRYPDLPHLELVLHDVDPERLRVAADTARHIAHRMDRPVTVTATLERRTALAGAAFAINMIQVGGITATRTDLEVPARHGLRQTIGDTIGVGGVFRALRTFPVLSGIAADMRDLCPTALLLNYTNPMAMNMWWLSAIAPDLDAVGLCHSVFWTVHDLCTLIGVPFDGTHYRAAGVNHQAWLTEWSRDGQCLYPLLRERIDASTELRRRARVEIFRRVGYYPTETSEHSAEYLPWFLRSDEQIAQFRLRPSEYLQTSAENLAAFEAARAALAGGRPLPIQPGAAEYAPQVIHSMLTGQEREIHANVVNRGLIENLPDRAVVEVPARVSHEGVSPLAVGAIPAPGAALNRAYLSVVELTVEAALRGDRELVCQAALADPNTASTLTPEQIWALCDAMFEAHARLLPESLDGRTPELQ